MMTQSRKRQTKLVRKKQAFIRPFEINIQPWNGIITSQDPYTIPEDTAVWISGLPKLTGAIESVLAPAVIYTHNTSIKDLFTFQLGQSQYFGLMDGARLRLYSDEFVQIRAFSTTREICDYAIQDNQYLWVVTRDFLIAFDGNKLYDLSEHNINGDCICYWKGRIFIGKDRTIIFSIPNPDPTKEEDVFNISRGAGSITITIGEFSKILALIPKEDSIYIFTDRNIISLIGTTISNDPNQWYIAEIVKEVGITGIRKYVKYEHTVYFHTHLGIYKIIATAPDKIDDAITNLTRDIKHISIAYYKQIPYIVVSATHALDSKKSALYFYNLLNKRWYALDVEADLLANFMSYTYFEHKNKVYLLFASDKYLPIQIKTKTYYSLDNTYLNVKDVLVYGRGSQNYKSDIFALSIAHARQHNKYTIFTARNRNIIFQTGFGKNLIFYSSSNFWSNVYKPVTARSKNHIFIDIGGENCQIQLTGNNRATMILPGEIIDAYAKRFDQFDFTFNQTDNRYSELINIKIRGTIGARYV